MSAGTSLSVVPILEAYNSVASHEFSVARLKSDLRQFGVPKGTVSKAAAILDALFDQLIEPEQVTSLSGAYQLVQMLRAKSNPKKASWFDSLTYEQVEQLHRALNAERKKRKAADDAAAGRRQYQQGGPA